MLQVCELVVTVAFTVEMLIRMIATGVRQYFGSGWNRFDAIIIVFG